MQFIRDVRRDLNVLDLQVVIAELIGPWVDAPPEWSALRRAQTAAAARPEIEGNVCCAET